MSDAGEVGLPSGVSIVIPVYNSTATLPELLERLTLVLADRAGAYEVVAVDDASRDDSWAVLEALQERHDHLVAIAMSRNFGQHAALLAGIRAARYDRIVTMDDDLQHRPEDIPTLLDALTADVDVVYGQSVEEEHGFWRSLSSRIVKSALAAAVGSEMAGKSSAFRAFRTRLRDAFSAVDDPYVSLDVLLSWATTRVAAVPVEMNKREQGASNYTFRSLVRHASNMLTGFSLLPLRIVVAMGFFMALVGAGLLAFVVGSFIFRGDTIPGFPFLASVIAIFGGTQLLALGVLGEYLGRVHFRSMHRPAYLIREYRTAERIGLDEPVRDPDASRAFTGFEGPARPSAP
jgi:undecaprenyl-phosphate 4-deoxy-4-formamido-L-arabinose transferase